MPPVSGDRRRDRALRLGLPITIGVLALGAIVVALLGGSPPPHVILISIDTLRPDRMGVYGHRPMGRSTTPFLDGLAAGGVVFERAYSTSSWTLPGHWSLLTGVPDELHGMIVDGSPPPGHLPLLAEILKEHGYVTGGFFSAPYLHPVFGFDRGFDTYESCMSFETMYDASQEERRRGGRSGAVRRAAGTEKQSHRSVTSDEVTRRGVEFVRQRRNRPFFLFLHYFDVHNDYIPPPPFDTSFGPPYDGWVTGEDVMTEPRYREELAPPDLARLLALYDGEIGWVDSNLRTFFERIEEIEPGILRSSLVIVTSDHGEQFQEHGKIGHRHSLRESEVRVPMIVHGPGRIPAGERSDVVARVYDVVPTVLDFAGLDIPPHVRGRSLLPALREGDTRERPALLELVALDREGRLDRFTLTSSLVHGTLKLTNEQLRTFSIRRPLDFDGEVLAEHVSLFDLARDPGEERDLAAVRPDVTRELDATRRALLEDLSRERAGRGGDGASEPLAIPEEIRRQLEALGYGG